MEDRNYYDKLPVEECLIMDETQDCGMSGRQCSFVNPAFKKFSCAPPGGLEEDSAALCQARHQSRANPGVCKWNAEKEKCENFYAGAKACSKEQKESFIGDNRCFQYIATNADADWGAFGAGKVNAQNVGCASGDNIDENPILQCRKTLDTEGKDVKCTTDDQEVRQLKPSAPGECKDAMGMCSFEVKHSAGRNPGRVTGIDVLQVKQEGKCSGLDNAECATNSLCFFHENKCKSIFKKCSEKEQEVWDGLYNAALYYTVPDGCSSDNKGRYKDLFTYDLAAFYAGFVLGIVSMLLSALFGSMTLCFNHAFDDGDMVSMKSNPSLN